MSGSSKGRSTISKDSIIEEVVTPLIKHLEIAEKRVVDPKSSGDNLKELFSKINETVIKKKAFFDKSKKWEGEAIIKFSEVERHIDNILEDEACNTNHELEEILKKLEEIVDKEIHSEEQLEETYNQKSNYEKGESSQMRMNEQEDEKEGSPMPFIDEIIDTLDPQLRHCLYCLSIFPKKSVIKRRLLVYWWIGLKLVHPDGEYTAEQIGGLLFDDLVDKGILIPYKTREHNKVVDQCTIQPIIHKKLISSARRKKFILEGEEIKDSNLKICTIRKNRLNVGTILNVNEKYLKSDDVISKSSDEKKISDVKNIAVMQVGQWKCVDGHHIEIDKTDFFNEPIPNLTYLSLQNISRIPKLPEPIGNSTSLMILDLRACHNLEKLPPKIKSLKNLTHLDVSMCYLLDHIPRWVDTLIHLEVFKGFVIGSAGNKNRCRLSDISRLSNLRKLSINIGRVSEVSAEDSNCLNGLSKLRSLTIVWGIDAGENEQEKSQVKRETEKQNVGKEDGQVEQEKEKQNVGKEPEIVQVEQETKMQNVSKESEIGQVKKKTKKQNAGKKPEIGQIEQEIKNQNVGKEPEIGEVKETKKKKVGTGVPSTKLVNIIPPEQVEKLDLRCFPTAEAPKWLTPNTLKNLKKLYIRGGNLGELRYSNADVWNNVEILRLRFLKNLKEMKHKDLNFLFPSLEFLELAERELVVPKKGEPVLSKKEYSTIVISTSFTKEQIAKYRNTDDFLFSKKKNSI